MAKQLNSLTWINRAISTDPRRHNLTTAWRSGTDMIATDGHHMHRILDLPLVTESKSIDPTSTENSFPDYNQVLPTKTPELKIEMHNLTFDLAVLKTLLKTLPKKSPYVTLAVNDSGMISLSAMHLVGVTGNELTFTVKGGLIDNNSIKELTSPYSVALNLGYFIEAIDGLVSWEMKFHGEFNAITIDSHIEGKAVQALIMPVRLPK